LNAGGALPHVARSMTLDDGFQGRGHFKVTYPNACGALPHVLRLNDPQRRFREAEVIVPRGNSRRTPAVGPEPFANTGIPPPIAPERSPDGTGCTHRAKQTGTEAEAP